MIIKVESLNRIFERNYNPNSYWYEGKCHHCECDTKVEITKTTGGYGLQGGVLHESNTLNLPIICSECFNKNGHKNSKEKQT